MKEIFTQILNMSISASFLILAILLIRLVFKKLPKTYMCFLWLMAAVKLIIPFSIKTKIGLSPSGSTIPVASIVSGENLYIKSGYDLVDNRVNLIINESINIQGTTVGIIGIWEIVSIIWFMGVIVMLIYFALWYVMLKVQISDAILLRENIYQSEKVKSPFVLGLIKPKIFVPYNLSDEELIIDHEKAHIKRFDHLSKPLSYVILALHFFNPLIWLAYFTFGKDVELACDEKAIGNYDSEKCKRYAYALLNTSLKGKNAVIYPISFGEVSVKERVRNAVSYKKPTFMGILSIILICIVCAGCFMTEPSKEIAEDFFGYAYSVEEKIYDSKSLAGKDNLEFVFSNKKMLFKKTDEIMASRIGQWPKIGNFEKIKTDKNFEKFFFVKGKWKDGYSLDLITKDSIVYKSVDKSINAQYFLIALENGDIYFGTGFYDAEGESDPYSDDSDIKKLYKMQRGEEEPENVGYIKSMGASNGITMIDIIRKGHENLPEGYEMGSGSDRMLGSEIKETKNENEFGKFTVYVLRTQQAIKKENGKTTDKINMAIPMKFVYSVSVYGDMTLASYEQANTQDEISEIFPKEYVDEIEKLSRDKLVGEIK